MKKIFTIIIFMIFLTSCSSISSGSGEKINPPSNAHSPFYGKWAISNLLSANTNNTKKTDQNVYSNLANKNFQITEDYFVLDGYYWDNIKYVTKLVSKNDYFYSIGTEFPIENNDKNNDIEVFSVLSNNAVLCDIIFSSDNKAVLNMSGNIYSITKTNSSTSIDISKLTHASNSYFNKKYKSDLKEGVLLGLKSPSKDKEGNDTFSYRTLWISKSNDSLSPIYEVDTILFPRKNGSFWTLSDKKVTHNALTENIFIPKDLSKTKSSDNYSKSVIIEDSSSEKYAGNILKEITYVCNDFVSVEVKGTISKDDDERPISQLQLYPISSLPYENAMSIDDIFKGTSLDFVKKQLSSALNSVDNSNTTFINSNNQNKNIGITRRNAHWFFTGRIEYFEGSKYKALDYDLNIVPPLNIVVYDSLFSPFNEIKNSIPYAEDAFSSPNNSMALIKYNNYLYIYNLSETSSSIKLYGDPIGKIKLKDNETIIMSEWAASGEYVDSWNNTVKSYETAKIIEE